MFTRHRACETRRVTSPVRPKTDCCSGFRRRSVPAQVFRRPRFVSQAPNCLSLQRPHNRHAATVVKKFFLKWTCRESNPVPQVSGSKTAGTHQSQAQNWAGGLHYVGVLSVLERRRPTPPRPAGATLRQQDCPQRETPRRGRDHRRCWHHPTSPRLLAILTAARRQREESPQPTLVAASNF